MDISFDVETYKDIGNGVCKPILDGTGKYFLIGSVTNEKGKSETFLNKDEMWQYILDLGRKARKHGHTIYAYGHNVKYDFYNIFKMNKNLVIISEFPFIASYYVTVKKEMELNKWNGYKQYLDLSKRRYTYKIEKDRVDLWLKEEAVRFLDSLSIFRTSLKNVGDIIGFKKLDLPKKLKKEDLKVITPYVTRDSEILIKAIKMLKKKINDDGVKIKRLVTMNQIAISYLLKLMRKEKIDIFKGEGNKLVQSKARRKVRKAYRGGRVEAWKLGIYKKVSSIDCNSLYPYSASIMRFPDLKTEIFWNKPKKEYWEKLLNKTGICRAMMFNRKCELGLLPIRLPHISYYPKKGKYLIGTWTNKEIIKAVKEGYEIMDIQFIISYDDIKNPFKNIMPNLYKLRMDKSLGGFNNAFYKSIMNGGIGKFAQTKVGQEIVFDSVDKTEDYIKKNYESLGGIRDNSRIMKFRKNNTNFNYKPYYCPIIAALVTAEARIYMYDIFKKIGLKRLVYTDTDSCAFIGNIKSLPKSIKLGKKLGQFKIEFEEEEFECWGRKSKRINDDLKMAGISKNSLKVYNKKKGIIKFVKMQGLRKIDTGAFIEQKRDLKKQLKDYKKQEEKLDSILVAIDQSILIDINKKWNNGKSYDDIKYFGEKLNKVNENFTPNTKVYKGTLQIETQLKGGKDL